MSEIELKPCPFCGSDDIKDDVYMRDGREVVCRECKARVGEFNPNANDKAVEKWNRRASEVSNEWVKWDGGNFMPVTGEAVVTVMLRDGSIEGPARAREFAGTESCWEHRDSDGDIIAYRLAQSDFDARIRSAIERKAEPVANAMAFFAENVDRWGAAEWFDRLAKAIREQDKAVVAGDDISFETYRMIAASSAMTLVRDHEATVRAALSASPATEPACYVSKHSLADLAAEGSHVAVSTLIHKCQLRSGNGVALYAQAPALSASPSPVDSREGLVAAAAKVRADYERANMKPCDCSTPDGALHYGRAQGLEMAADMLSASPSPVDSRELIERLVKALEEIAASRRMNCHEMSDEERAEYWSALALRYRSIASKALAAKEQQP